VRALDDDGIDEPPHLLRRGLPRRERLLDVLLRPGEDDDGFAPLCVRETQVGDRDAPPA